jgi:citronellol/citronellal dehydrogenase
LWPRTVIATDAMNMIPGVQARSTAVRPEIMADAAQAVLVQRRDAQRRGRFFIDEDVLRAKRGVTDLSGYAIDPSLPLLPDLFLD